MQDANNKIISYQLQLNINRGHWTLNLNQYVKVVSRRLKAALFAYHVFSNSKAASLAARLVESNHRPHYDEEEDEDAIFAELEEEIENDSNPVIREQGLKFLKEE